MRKELTAQEIENLLRNELGMDGQIDILALINAGAFDAVRGSYSSGDDLNF